MCCHMFKWKKHISISIYIYTYTHARAVARTHARTRCKKKKTPKKTSIRQKTIRLRDFCPFRYALISCPSFNSVHNMRGCGDGCGGWSGGGGWRRAWEGEGVAPSATFSALNPYRFHTTVSKWLWWWWWLLLYSAVLRSRADSLRSHVILSTWVTSFYSAFLNIHYSGVVTALAWLVPRETAAVTAQVLCTPYNHAPCHFTQIFIKGQQSLHLASSFKPCKLSISRKRRQ